MPHDYLYFFLTADVEKAKDEISPWHCFTLIPEKTTAGELSLATTLSFMQFIKWAIYYYNILTYEYNRIPKEYKNSKIIFGTIRNPWDWYVSWYHKLQMGHKIFSELYKDKNFETFLVDLFNRQHGCVRDLDFHEISNCNIGIISYRYSKCFLKTPLFNSKDDFIKSQKSFFLTDLCSFPTMKQDLIRILKLNKNQINMLNNSPRVNTSEHKPYQEYYNSKTKKLVYEKDQFLIDKYGFKF